MSEHIESKVIAFRKELDKKRHKNPDPNTMFKRLGVDHMTLQLGSDFVPLADPENDGKLLPKLHQLRLDLTDRLGFIMPNIRVMDCNKIACNEYIFSVHNVMVSKGKADLYSEGSFSVISPHWTILTDSGSKQGYQHLRWKERLDLNQCDIALNNMVTHIEQRIILNIDRIFNRMDTLKLMELVKQHDKVLVTDIIPNRIAVCFLQEILTSLLQEEVSIKDIMFVFERIHYYVHKKVKPELIAEKLRQDLAPAICVSWRDEDGNLPAIVITPGKNLLESEEELSRLIKLIEKHASQKGTFHNDRPCLISPPETRRKLFEKLTKQVPGLIVLSQEEITYDTNIIAVNEI